MKKRVYWTQEQVIKESKKYSSISEWRESSRGSYKWARQYKINIPHLPQKIVQSPTYSIKRQDLNPSLCLKVAKKFKNKRDWRLSCISSFNYASKRPKLMSQCTKHMSIKQNSQKRLVYVFLDVFENYAYVGLTYDLRSRFNQHINSKKEFKKSLENGNLCFGQLTQYISEKQAQKTEEQYISHFKEKGFNLLNKSKAGSLGSTVIHIWTKEKCIHSAKKAKTFGEWQKKYSGAVSAAYKKGWIDDCRKYLKKKKYAKNTCYKQKTSTQISEIKKESLAHAKKYNRPCDWKKENYGSWKKAYRLGILDECYKHMTKRMVFRNLSDNVILNIALNYQTKLSWLKEDPSSYNKALKRKLMEKATLHMKNNRTIWTQDLVLMEALKHNKVDFTQKCRGAYAYALRNNLLNQLKYSKSSQSHSY